MAKKVTAARKLSSTRKVSRTTKAKTPEVMQIGGSPMPGIVLKQILPGHTDTITSIAWSLDGRYLASASDDRTIRIWDIQMGECETVLTARHNITSVAWAPSGRKLVAGDSVGNICFWDIKNARPTQTMQVCANDIRGVDWSSNDQFIAFGTGHDFIGTLVTNDLKLISEVKGSSNDFVSFSPDGSKFAATNRWSKINLWDLPDWNVQPDLTGHAAPVRALAWKPNSEILASGSDDKTIRIWNIGGKGKKLVLEGNKASVRGLSFNGNGSLLASYATNGTICLWDTSTWDLIGSLQVASTNSDYTGALSFHPNLDDLATLGSDNKSILIWNVNYHSLLGGKSALRTVRYISAKLVIVGDSGVGKTGLGWRLAHNDFKEHSSTHGQQFWVVPELKKTRDDGTECEAVLWDLAGQHIYRSIHSIFLDDVDAALVLFDPTNRQDPLKGVQFWLEQLRGKKQLPPTVLIGGRLDRGESVLSDQELEQFCQQYRISGGYIGTSARSGEGVDRLLSCLQAKIPWDQMTTTVTTITFKKIKEYVLELKEKTDRKGVLVRPDELRKQLQATDKEWKFTNAEMMTVVGHLANHGYVTTLHSSSGQEHILLVPDLLVDLASSIVLLADKHMKELGAINEAELLQGKYQFDELRGLENSEQHILLDAAVLRFLEHSICFRETLGSETLLIFPNLIKQKRPLQDDYDLVDDISYVLHGHIENIYASLVVLLGYTTMFTRINQWHNQAQYETGEKEICGFRLIEEREGELELILYYSTTMPAYGRTMFQGLFETFLYKRDVNVTRFPPVFCPQNHLLPRSTVIKHIREGKNSIFCSECGEKTKLPEIEKPTLFEQQEAQKIRKNEAIAHLRRLYETYMVRIKSFRRDRAIPQCYVSYVEEDELWSARLKSDLQIAGVQIIEDRKYITDDCIILVVNTAVFQAMPKKANSAIARATNNRNKKLSTIYLQIDGAINPDKARDLPVGDMRHESRYAVSLFDLVLRLYAIPLEHPAFKPLRESLYNQWFQTLANMDRREIYVSYAWGGESEEIVNDLESAFQTQGVTLIRDKHELGYKGRIQSFMETIGRGKAIVVVISEKYLKSENCMFELLQISKNGQFTDRIFPIVLENTHIYTAVDRLRYIEHWETRLRELDKGMKNVSAANLDGFREEIDLYTEFRRLLPELMNILKDMNTLTTQMHRKSNFSIIFNAVMAKLSE